MTHPSDTRQDAGSGPALPAVQMHLHTPADPGTGVVVSSEPCSRGKSAGFTRHIVIDVGQTRLAGAFRSGQSFGVLPPGNDDRGRPHQVRLYSIASPTSGEDGGGRHLATTVKRTIEEHRETHRLFLGVASNYLCDLQPGDHVTVTGPNGKRFVLPENTAEHDFLFFATGTGIAPFRGMSMDLFEKQSGAPSASRAVLVMGSAYQTDLLYDEDFRRLASRHSRFEYLTAISRHHQEDAPDPMYVQHRLRTHRDRLTALLESPRTLVYICGISGMEVGIFQEMARILPPAILDQYLHVTPEARAGIDHWNRSMINRQVKPTRRVLTEVYT